VAEENTPQKDTPQAAGSRDNSTAGGPTNRVDVPKGTWTQCPKCEAMVYQKALEEALYVCPECDYHHRITARTRIKQLVNEIQGSHPTSPGIHR